MKLIDATVFVKIEMLLKNKIGSFIAPILGEHAMQDKNGEIIYNPELHKVIYGTIVAAPDKVTVTQPIIPISEGFPEPKQYRSSETLLAWSEATKLPITAKDRESTCYLFERQYINSSAYEIDFKVGDKVYFNYQSLKPHNLVGELTYRILFRDLLCKVTDKKIEAICGNVLCKPIKEETVLIDGVEYPVEGTLKGNIVTSLHKRSKYLTAKVAHIPKPLKGDSIDINEGDVIIYPKNHDWEVEIEGDIYYPIPYWKIEAKID